MSAATRSFQTVAVGSTGVFALCLAVGLQALPSLLFVLVFALSASAGLGFWLLVAPRRPRHPFELLGVGTVLGAGLVVALDQGLRVVGLQQWLWLVLLLAAAVAYLAPRRSSVQVEQVVMGDWASVAVAGGVSFLGLLPILRENLVGANGIVQVNGDAPYREAVSNSVHLLGSADSLLVPGGTIRYHWIGNDWVGAVTDLTGPMPFVAQVRYLPIVVFGCVLLIAWTIARSMTGSRWSASMGAMLAVLGGALGLRLHDAGGILTNSFGISMIFAGMAALACFRAWQVAMAEPWRWTMVPAFGALAFLTSGARLTTGAIVLGSSVVAMLLGARSGRFRRLMLLSGAALAGLIGGYLLIALVPAPLAMDSTPTWSLRFSDFFLAYQGLLPFPGALGVLLGLLALLLGVVGPLLGVLGLEGGKRILSRPELRWGLGALLSGLAGLMLTYNFGLSHFTFLVPAMMPLLLLSGAGAGVVLSRKWREGTGPRWVWVSALMAYSAVLAAGVVGMSMVYGVRFDALIRWAAPVVFVGGVVLGAMGARVVGVGMQKVRFLPAVAVIAASTTLLSSMFVYAVRSTVRPLIGERPITWTAGEFAAGEWLANNVPLDVLVATNRQCNYPEEVAPECVSTTNSIAALASRRALIEGAFYSIGSADKSIWPQLDEHFQDIEASVAFGDAPSPRTQKYLWDRGVRYVWIDRRFTDRKDWTGFAAPVFAQDNVVVLKLDPPRAVDASGR